MTDYFELQIKINPEIEDVVSEMCFETFDCEGVVLAEETYKDLEMISTTEGTLRVFIRDEKSPEALSDIVTGMKNILQERGLSESETGSFECKVIACQNQDWSKKWKEKWDITRVSDRIVVVPDWLEYCPVPDEIVIRIEPGCAFGTGTHSTTQLCMKAIEKYMQKNAKVADIGTGSGILAICAKKFGAATVYGCDNDETVIDVAKENAVKNNVQCVFELNTADKLTDKYDFVLANILHNVLANIMGDLKNIMKDGAYMVLSGILDEKKKVVLEAVQKHGLELVEEMHQNQWVALIVRKS